MSATARADLLAGEEPLGIRVDGAALTMTMRTPGDDIELAAGFLVGEAIVAATDDIAGMKVCDGTTCGHLDHADGEIGNIVDVALAPGVTVSPAARRSFLTTSACGVCGKTSIDDICVLPKAPLQADATVFSPAMIASMPDRLREAQRVFSSTGGLHAAGLFTASGELLVVREDVGRHNAVDKIVGWALLNAKLPLTGCALLVSGRASFELVQKAVLAGIPLLAAVSAPSSLAAELADEAGLTLIGFLRGPSMNVYTGVHRVRRHEPRHDRGRDCGTTAARRSMSPASSGQPRPALAYALWLDSLTRAGWDAGPAAEQVPVADALGRVSADPIVARWPSPRSDCSAMDGIAVRAARLTAAATADGTRRRRAVRLPAGTFEWIDTGDPMPAGADTVVMREWLLPQEDGGVIIVPGGLAAAGQTRPSRRPHADAGDPRRRGRSRCRGARTSGGSARTSRRARCSSRPGGGCGRAIWPPRPPAGMPRCWSRGSRWSRSSRPETRSGRWDRRRGRARSSTPTRSCSPPGAVSSARCRC